MERIYAWETLYLTEPLLAYAGSFGILGTIFRKCLDLSGKNIP